MCSALHKANRKMLSCWTLLPASAAPDDAEQECHCSGKHMTNMRGDCRSHVLATHLLQLYLCHCSCATQSQSV
jgi:hypothetical protein